MATRIQSRDPDFWRKGGPAQEPQFPIPSDPIVRVKSDHPLWSTLPDPFKALGRYLFEIKDPAGRVAPFFVVDALTNPSDLNSVLKTSYSNALRHCGQNGGSLLTLEQAQSLIRAQTKDGVFNNESVALFGSRYWILENPSTHTKALIFESLFVEISYFPHEPFSMTVFCAYTP